jgi:Fe-S cluster assembly iron-binding protein IscA
MLTLTENASTAVRTLTEQAGLPDDTGGLRIAGEESGGFGLAMVAEAVPGDDVVSADGATVYLDPSSSQALAGQCLDVEPTPQGSSFTLSPQG